MLLSAQGDVGPADANAKQSGFDITDARLLVRGKLEKGWGYLLQTEFTFSAPILDLIIDWESADAGTRISTGLFRSPFSAELLIAAPDLDLIDRSQIVRALAPARQVGIQLDQQLLGDALVARAGIFNGEGRSANSDAEFLYMLRFDGRIDCGDGVEFEYGLNGAYSNDDEFDRDLSSGNRDVNTALAGGDFRLSNGPVFFSAEGIYGSFTSSVTPNHETWGYHASVGWELSRLVQLLARYDSFTSNGLQEDRDLAIGSMVLNFTDYVNLQVELRVPTRGEKPTPGAAGSLSVQF